MPLKEQFLNLFGLDRWEKAEKGVKICDEFAIGFIETVGGITNEEAKELLGIYKKENNL